MKFGPPLVGLPHSRKPQFIHLLVGKNAGETWHFLVIVRTPAPPWYCGAAERQQGSDRRL